MFDLIVLIAVLAALYGAFELGHKYKTLTELYAAVKAKIGQ